MKRKVLLLAVITLATVSACKKENTTFSTSIKGEWELRANQSGMSQTIHYIAGNGNKLVFDGSNYTSYQSNQMVKKGTYFILNDLSAKAEVCFVLPPDQFKNRIIFDNDTTSRKTFIQISHDTLNVMSGCFAVDAGSWQRYVRL